MKMSRRGGVKSLMSEIHALLEEIEKISDYCDSGLNNQIHFPPFEVEVLYKRFEEFISEIKKLLHKFRHMRFVFHRTNSIYYLYLTEQLHFALHSLSVYHGKLYKRWCDQNKRNAL